MPPDLVSLLHDAAPEPEAPISGSAVAALATRRHRRRAQAGATAASILIVITVGLVIGTQPLARQTVRAGQPGSSEASSSPADPTSEATSVPAPRVQPATGLVSRQAVTVSATGLPPDQLAGLVLCSVAALAEGRGRDACSETSALTVRTSDDGSVTEEFWVARTINIPASGWVDCAAVPDTCAIAVGTTTIGSDVGAWTPLSFATDPDPVGVGVARLAVDAPVGPGGDAMLTDGEQVAISGRGFPAGKALTVGVCPPSIDCVGFLQPVTTDAAGTFALTIPVTVTLRYQQATADGGTLDLSRDCTTGCSIIASTADGSALDVEPVPISIAPA